MEAVTVIEEVGDMVEVVAVVVMVVLVDMLEVVIEMGVLDTREAVMVVVLTVETGGNKLC